MTDETEIKTKDGQDVPFGKAMGDESHFFSLSIRSLIVLELVTVVALMSFEQIEVKEPLYTLVGLAVGYYFGQKEKPKSQS